MTRQRLDLARRRSAQATAAAGVAITALDLAVLLEKPAPAIDWLWNGYLEMGTVAQLHGDGGAGKSILAAALARAITGGHDFLGRETFIGRVVVIDGENPLGEIHRRLDRLEYQSVTERVRYFVADDAIFTDHAQTELLLTGLADAQRADLIVLDSQRALWPGEENEAIAVRRFYAMLRRVAYQTGAAVLVLHHDRRAGGYSGSSDLNAGVDSRLHLIRDEDGRVTLKHEKLRSDVEQPPVSYRLHLEDERYAFTIEEAGTPREALLDALTGEWQTAPEIAKAAGVRRDQAQQLLTALTRSGDAETATGPPGRSSKAICWKRLVRTRDESGRVPHGRPVTDSSPDLHTPVGGGGGTSHGRALVPGPDELHPDDVRWPE
jgi:hypothetical protein